ncbi:MAG TPA: amidohydrolase family protein, partial [Dehalococcoidia bacterium]|nr:amidohydrolase family protein [Dehalococcoidia bacterium]
HDYEILRRLALASGRPTLYNGLGQNWNQPGAWRRTLDFCASIFKEKGQLWSLAFADRLDTWFDLKTTRMFMMDMPAFRDVMRRPLEEKLTLLADPAVRDRLRADVADATPRIFSKNWDDILVDLPRTPANEGLRGRSIAAIARSRGQDPLDTFLDVALSEQLETGFKYHGLGNGDPEAVAEIMADPYVLPGVSDAGAHMDVLSFYGVPAMVIGKWHRDKGVLSLEEAVRRVTSLPATVYGIPDRGAIREGLAADLVIFDRDRIRACDPRPEHDLPGGEMRLVQDAEGIIRSIVNGQVLVEEGRHTGNLPGQLIRNRKAMS